MPRSKENLVHQDLKHILIDRVCYTFNCATASTCSQIYQKKKGFIYEYEILKLVKNYN